MDKTNDCTPEHLSASEKESTLLLLRRALVSLEARCGNTPLVQRIKEHLQQDSVKTLLESEQEVAARLDSKFDLHDAKLVKDGIGCYFTSPTHEHKWFSALDGWNDTTQHYFQIAPDPEQDKASDELYKMSWEHFVYEHDCDVPRTIAESKAATLMLMMGNMSAMMTANHWDYLNSFAVYCTHEGTEYRLVGASTMGDVFLKHDPEAEAEIFCNYDKRVLAHDCSDWREVSRVQ